MRKKLSFLIALAISLGVTTTSFAAEVNNTNSNNIKTNAIVIDKNSTNLTLEEALNKLEANNQELKSMDDKIEGITKQNERDNMDRLAIDKNKVECQYPTGQYLQVMMLQQVTPVQNEKNINDSKNEKDEKLNSLKFDLQREYMNAITAKTQVDNINRSIANLDEQIKQTEAKINLGQATKDAVTPLKVQKSQFMSQLSVPSIQLQQSLLNVKKYLNIDASVSLNLAPAKKDFVKFDDTSIENKINEAIKKDYTLNGIQKSIDITKTQIDLYTKYAVNGENSLANLKLGLQDLESKTLDTNTNQQVSLWKAYYNLKNKENTMQTQMLNQEYAQMTYDKAKQSLGNGMIDKVALDSAELAFNNQKVLTQQAINDYMITQDQFKYILNGHNSLAASIK